MSNRSLHDMLLDIGIAHAPGKIVNHRALTGPDGAYLGEWDAEAAWRVLQQPDPLQAFRDGTFAA